MKRRTKKKIAILVFEVIVLLILVCYMKTRTKYEEIFCNDTIINGVDCSLLTVEEAKEAIQFELEQYVLEIIFKDDEIENISGTEIGLSIENLEQKLNNIKKQQRRNLFFTGGTYNLDNYSYDVEKLEKLLSSKEQLKTDYMEEKTKIEYRFNLDSKLFEINEQNIYYLDFNQVFEEVSKAINEKKEEISVQNLYLVPDDISTLEELNSIISAEITYQLPQGEKYVLDASILCTWLVQEDGTYFKDEEVWNQNLEDFVTNQLSSLTDTVGETREFKPTGLDEVVLVEGGNYGYLLDDEAEIQQLSSELKNGEIVTREPCYAKKEVDSEENYGLGESYVEIDLTRQKVWVYVNGNIEIETDCVTGCINDGHETPTGIYTLTYKTTNKILRGDKLSNGTYEYESHVDYWMPFNGGIGLHDASWRSTFGGNIYINNGSHGCINLPLEAAKELYSIINEEMPIIVYKSE